MPVHEAASSGRIELVEWLLQQRPNHINSSSNDGRTILHIACGSDKIDMCKMLIDMGADVNAVYRNTRNVVKTPLDCALQRGFRSTAKFIQMHGGLPANKLRLSGRKTQTILPELDEVKPLKFTEIEVTYERKESSRGRHTSVDTDTDTESSRGRHRSRKHHRKCSHKRRTSSCSEMFICHRVDEPCEINRSKSSTELHRKKSGKHQRSLSTESSDGGSESGSQSDSDEDEDDDCCYHVKRKHRCYKKVKTKSRDSSNGSNSKKGRNSSKKGSDDNDHGRAKRDNNKKKESSSAKKNDNKASSKAKGNDTKSSSTTGKQAGKKRPTSGKPLLKKGSQDEKNKSIDRTKTPEVSIDMDQPPSSTLTEAKAKSIDDAGSAAEDEKVIKEITTQVEIHDTTMLQQQTDVDDGAATDATYTIEKRDKNDIMTVEPEVIKEEVIVTTTTTTTTTASVQENSKKVSFKGDENEVSQVTEEEPTAPVPEQPQVIIEVEHTVTIENEQEKAFETIPDSANEDSYDVDMNDSPEEVPRPKSQTPESIASFTVLEDGDDAEQKLKEFEEMTQDDYESEQQYYDDSSSMEKIPKRSVKILDDDRNQEDSGIEPSPRSQRTKIPGLRSTHSSAVQGISRRSFVITDDRPRSTRIEGRKPGDKNAVNMTTVTQSIQKNIRR